MARLRTIPLLMELSLEVETGWPREKSSVGLGSCDNRISWSSVSPVCPALHLHHCCIGRLSIADWVSARDPDICTFLFTFLSFLLSAGCPTDLQAARLRLPTTLSNEAISIIVEQTIDELGLRDAAETVVGGPLRKGISGGEKRWVYVSLYNGTFLS